jgi:uncharacterized protein (TIGR02453 family)
MKRILAFLSDLTDHNDRDWMTANKKYYQEAKKAFEEQVNELIEGISGFDEELVGLAPKDCIFRINRDIRFSKDKSPYKTNFGAAMTPGGKKNPLPTYYIHVQPGNSFLAGGMYMPQPAELAKIRQEIDYNAGELKKIVEDSDFQKTWGQLTGEELKTAPKGYPKDHPNIDLIRKKSFIVVKNLSNEELLTDQFTQEAIRMFKILYPFNQYLSVAVKAEWSPDRIL